MKIGNIEIDKIAAMAPMAGVADKAVRTIVKSFGAAFTVGEMTSAKGVIMKSENSRSLLIPDSEGISAIQLFASNPQDMENAVKLALEFSPMIIDINMGCPAPKITSGGAGSALLKDIKLCGKIAEAAVKSAQGTPITAKIRKGYNNGDDVAVDAARVLESVGVAAITVHARTREQMYAPPIDIDAITRVKSAVKIPIIGNGDIFFPQDAINMLNRTHCDMVMVGRGALGNPWIFRDINNLYEGGPAASPPSVEEKMEVMMAEIELLIQDKGEYTGFKEARKHVSWYLKYLKGATIFREMCGKISCLKDVEEIKKMAIEANRAI